MNIFQLNVVDWKAPNIIDSYNSYELIDNKQYRIVDINERISTSWEGNWKIGSIVTYLKKYGDDNEPRLIANFREGIPYNWIYASFMNAYNIKLQEIS